MKEGAEMSKIIGIAQNSFTPKDSDTKIEGVTIHITDPIPPGKGKGVSTERFFLLDKKMEQLPFTPVVDMEIEVLYNRWGKVETLRLLNTPSIGTDID